MKKWFNKIRYKLAYLIAPDWIDDLEHRLSGLLCEVTGGRLSKCYYPLRVMMDEYWNNQVRGCEDCVYYREQTKESPKED